MTEQAQAPAEVTKMNRAGVVSWAFYDWANSPFITVVTTFVFAAYFTKARSIS